MSPAAQSVGPGQRHVQLNNMEVLREARMREVETKIYYSFQELCCKAGAEKLPCFLRSQVSAHTIHL